MTEVLTQVWTIAFALAHTAAAIAITVDAVLRKRHVSAVFGWVGLAWLAPGIGSILCLVFGINRIRRNAIALGLRNAWEHAGHTTAPRDASRHRGCAGFRVTGQLHLRQRQRRSGFPSGFVRCPQARRGSAHPDRRAGLALQPAGHAGRPAPGRHHGSRVLAHPQSAALTLCQSSQPPQDHGGRRPHWLHRWHEHPRRTLAGEGASAPGAMPALWRRRADRRGLAKNLCSGLARLLSPYL